MKLLVIGLDGGTEQILEAFGCLERLKSKYPYRSHELDEDLFERGWAKLVTGLRGDENRGFYMYPDMTSKNFTTKFSLDLEEESGLWNRLSKERAVFVNVPTMTNVKNVPEGVKIVGSGGGGLNSLEGIPGFLIDNDLELEKLIKKHNYIFDIRIPTEKYHKVEELLNDLTIMENNRFNLFDELLEVNRSNFGMVVDRGVTIVQYLLMSVIQDVIDNGLEKELLGANKEIVHSLVNFYEALADRIFKTIDRVNPKSFVITADHSTVPHKMRASVAALLALKSNKSVPIVKMSALLSQKNKAILNQWLERLNLKSIVPAKRGKLFGNKYINGVYVNDDRFDSLVAEDERNELIEDFINWYNSLEFSVTKGSEAYRNEDGFGTHRICRPDIVFSNLQGVHFDNIGKSWLYTNENYRSKFRDDLTLYKHAAVTGDKGAHPLCLTYGVEYCGIKVKDLRDVYSLIVAQYD